MNAATRAGVPLNETLWNTCGHAATARMLDEVMPNGYHNVVYAIEQSLNSWQRLV